MKRVLSRLIASSLVIGSLSVALVQPAAARPRSWFLPALTVSCTIDGEATQPFAGAMQLNAVAFLKDEMTVGGTISGFCDPFSIDTPFRTPISVVESSCDEATLAIGDIRVKDMTIHLSDDPVVVTADGPGPLRGALCSLTASLSGKPTTQAKALNRVLALQG